VGGLSLSTPGLGRRVVRVSESSKGKASRKIYYALRLATKTDPIG